MTAQLERELTLIEELDYCGYFLTMWEIVQYCRRNDILCQGRGSAANSAVCYCLGITAVVDHQGRLVGAVSDGDLRRLLEEDRGGRSDLLDRSAKSCMRPTPKTIPKNALVLDALQSMEDHRITSLFVCDEEERLIGVVHIHDLWGLQLR